MDDCEIPYKNILVTGASGCLGWNICRQLNKRGIIPHISIRDSTDLSRLRGIDVSIANINLYDKSKLYDAIHDLKIEAIIHCAANVSHDIKDIDLSYKDNVVVTQNLIKASIACGVKEFIYTSTGATLDISDDDIEFIKNPYIKHKKIAENIVISAIDRIKVNITNPIIIIGKNDNNNYSELFNRIINDKFKIIFPGEIEFCSAELVAEAHLKILTTNINGQKFALGGEMLSWLEFSNRISKLSKKKLSKKSTSKTILYMLSYLFYIKSIFGCEKSKLTPDLIKLLSKKSSVPIYYSKISEYYLDYEQKSIWPAIEDCHRWLSDIEDESR